MPSTKYEGFSYPTSFLKSRSSVIRNNFLEYRIIQTTLFARRNDFYALFATKKAKHILKRHFRASVVTQFLHVYVLYAYILYGKHWINSPKAVVRVYWPMKILSA